MAVLPIRVKMLEPNVREPEFKSLHAAAMDIYLPSQISVLPQTQLKVDMKFEIAIPSNYYGQLALRSSTSIAFPQIRVLGGIIDADYRGSLYLCLFNHSVTETYVFEEGKAIAQMMLVKLHPDKEIQLVESLGRTTRGKNGFGSTDLHFCGNEVNGAVSITGLKFG